MNEIIVIIIAFIVHEFGHWITYRILGYKAKIKFKWYGIVVGEEIWHNVKLKHAFPILAVGIFLGYIPIVILTDNAILDLTYFLLSSGDLVNIMGLLDTKKEHLKKLTILENLQRQVKELSDKKR